VFGDDRVYGTREQMMLQMDLVRPRDGVGMDWEKRAFQNFYVLWFLNKILIFILSNLIW